jgi:hypothetical protein
MRYIYKLILILSLYSLSGCSVYMAANQPPAKNIDLFKVGTPRSALLAEFGYPTSSEVKEGKKYDIYRFTQGYSGGAKAGRAMAHGIASVLTLGIWEVIGTPVEAANSGDLTAYEVGYGSDDRVDVVISLIQTANTSASPASTDQSNNVPPAFRDNPPPAQSTTAAAPTTNFVTQSATPNTLPNPAAKLEQLDQMRQKGLITQKDYDLKKAEVLKNL